MLFIFSVYFLKSICKKNNVLLNLYNLHILLSLIE